MTHFSVVTASKETTDLMHPGRRLWDFAVVAALVLVEHMKGVVAVAAGNSEGPVHIQNIDWMVGKMVADSPLPCHNLYKNVDLQRQGHHNLGRDAHASEP